MNPFRGIARLLLGSFLVTFVASAIAAVVRRQQVTPVDAPDADEIRLAAVFEPIGYRSTARAFRGGSVDCWFGGGYVDLRAATLDPTGATLRVRAIFGGGQVVVPEGWNVTSRVVGIGGIGDGRARSTSGEAGPELRIEGVVLFGGFAVTSELAQAEIDGIAQAIARRKRRLPTEATAEPAA